MQAILDHIGAVLVGAVILVIVVGLQFRAQSANVDVTQFYAAKKGVLSVVEYLEQDFKNIGAGIDSVANNAIQHYDTLNGAFRFWAQTAPNTAPNLIEYTWTGADSVDIKRPDGSFERKPLYTIERLVDGSVSGSNAGMITDFEIRLFTADSVSVTDNTGFPQVRQVLVQLSAVSPVGVGQYIQQSRYQNVYRPVNLTRDN